MCFKQIRHCPLIPKQQHYLNPCQQHQDFPTGLRSKYYPGPMWLKFSVQMETGAIQQSTIVKLAVTSFTGESQQKTKNFLFLLHLLVYIPIGNGATGMPPVLDEEHSCSAELCCARLNLASNSFFQVNKHFILRTSKSSLKNKFNRSALLLFLLFNVFCSSRQVDKIEISRKSGKKVFFFILLDQEFSS